jgi:SAM-dependent methyltransferase
MLEWPRYSVSETPAYLELRGKIKNPGPGRPKTWAYPWCLLNAGLEPDMLVLDFGCGTYSNFTYYISEITRSLTVGLDAAGVRKQSGKVRFVQNAAETIEFPPDFFDRVVSISVLEHVPVPLRRRVWSEIFRVLRPGGWAVLTIDWIFGLDDRLLKQLIDSPHLRQRHSTMYGNYNFAEILSELEPVAAPLRAIPAEILPGAPEFEESRILADTDILVTTSDMIPDVEPFRFTTVGLILRKRGRPAAREERDVP